MTQTPASVSAAHLHTSNPDDAGVDVTDLAQARRKTEGDVEDLATRAARARQINAHRATYAAAAVHRHGQVSRSDADGLPEALVELLADLHHLCDSCDIDLAPLYQAAVLVHARETHAA
ncbi:hypothetical protein [Kineococcus sp. SYSU DK003]|uniref:hypothetical protein n=1 Tax=Kineococcus sp. SYSU DK003 TaxID=3383124 RepID=UPI003D7E343B